MWLHMWLHMRLLGQLTIVSPLIVTSLVLHLTYQNLDFSTAKIGRASCRERV